MNLASKNFEVGSYSNLGDAQARRLLIRVKGENGTYFVHTLNNSVVAICTQVGNWLKSLNFQAKSTLISA